MWNYAGRGLGCTDLTGKLHEVLQLTILRSGNTQNYEAWSFLCMNIRTGQRETCVWPNNEKISNSK